MTRFSLLRFCAVTLAGAGCLAAQSKRPEDLDVGKILVTPSEAPDPVFAEKVILLVRYSASGALGLTLNKRTNVPISRVLKDAAVAAKRSEPVFVGGPVELDTIFALVRSPHNPEGAREVRGDVYFITAKAALEKALGGDAGPSGFRLYLGYCGWGPRQLDNEVRLGGWYIFDHSQDLAFDPEPASLWRKLVARAEDRIARLNSLRTGTDLSKFSAPETSSASLREDA